MTCPYELKRDDDSKAATIAFAVPSGYKFLIGPGDTRKGTDHEIFLRIPHQRRRPSRLRDSRKGKPCYIPVWMGTEQEKLEVFVPERMPHARERSHRKTSQDGVKN